MLKSITLTRHETVESWNNWIVSVPDNMEDERIEELMRELLEKGELALDEEERQDDGEPSIDISDAPPAATVPHLTLTENGFVDDEALRAMDAEVKRGRAALRHLHIEGKAKRNTQEVTNIELIELLKSQPPKNKVNLVVDEGERNSLGIANPSISSSEGHTFLHGKKPTPTWGRAAWCDEDIEKALEKYGIEASPELIKSIKNTWVCRNIADLMVEDGWEYIYMAIHEVVKDNENGDLEPDEEESQDEGEPMDAKPTDRLQAELDRR